jgi:hypothetical protein
VTEIVDHKWAQSIYFNGPSRSISKIPTVCR